MFKTLHHTSHKKKGHFLFCMISQRKVDRKKNNSNNLLLNKTLQNWLFWRTVQSNFVHLLKRHLATVRVSICLSNVHHLQRWFEMQLCFWSKNCVEFPFLSSTYVYIHLLTMETIIPVATWDVNWQLEVLRQCNTAAPGNNNKPTEKAKKDGLWLMQQLPVWQNKTGTPARKRKRLIFTWVCTD